MILNKSLKAINLCKIILFSLADEFDLKVKKNINQFKAIKNTMFKII